MTDKMRIALLIDASMDGQDGVQQFVKALGDELMERGHYVKYLTGHSSDDNPRAEHIHSMSKVINVRINGNVVTTPLPVSKKKVSEMLDREKFDIMHVTVPHSPLMASRIIMQAAESMPIVGTFHIDVDTKIAAIGARLLAMVQKPFSLSKFSYWTGASDVAANFGKKYYKIDSNEITYNPIKISRFEGAKPLRESNGKRRIVFLGRLVERKGAQQIIEALPYLKQETRDSTEVIIGGKGALLEGLKKRVSELGYDDLVEFSGFVPEEDKARFLAMGDICVFPSSGGECFGISLTEPMAVGRGVVLGGDNNGYRNVLGEHDLLLFDPKDPKVLAQKIEYFLENPEAAEEAIKWQSKSVKQYDTKKFLYLI